MNISYEKDLYKGTFNMLFMRFSLFYPRKLLIYALLVNISSFVLMYTHCNFKRVLFKTEPQLAYRIVSMKTF